ncbi:hypothetical protein ATCC90586_008612 [Pythium insidiosum]|nr:hypothetical protein ATCC90586_008612 [Pythium insidiosum]
MKTSASALMLQVNEISRELGETSVNWIKQSWEAGGVYPTLIGYALGAVATVAILTMRHWMARFGPAVACFVLLLHVLWTVETTAFAVLAAFASIVGVGCTCVQVLSWRDALSFVEHRRKMKKARRYKVDKED